MSALVMLENSAGDEVMRQMDAADIPVPAVSHSYHQPRVEAFGAEKLCEVTASQGAASKRVQAVGIQFSSLPAFFALLLLAIGVASTRKDKIYCA